ncbi:MAG: protein kinase [Chloroflexota bacterium]|nr:protein kinase [Chloroflexota bacterium]
MVSGVGQKLGNYRLIQLLGQGGFAYVYLAEHMYLKTPAAIKILQLHLTRNAFEQFLAEARTIARLAHPHIVQVLDFGIEESTPYLVMSYAPYGSLRQRHPKGSVLATTTIISYVKQIAQALQYAHDRGVIHRDMKPENILLGPDQALMLADFGIAISEDGTPGVPVDRGYTLIGVVGTTTYMAPEQFDGKSSQMSDQYALGVVVYEWLCGAPPFRGSNIEIARQHIQEPHPSLLTRVPTLAPAIEQVVMRALAKDSRARFACVRDFASALEAACTSVVSTGAMHHAPAAAALFVPAMRPPALVPNTPPLDPELAWHASATVANTFAGKREPAAPHAGALHRVQAPALPLQLPPGSRRPLSRRQVVAGLSIAGIAALGAGGIWSALLHSQQATPLQSHLPDSDRVQPVALPTSPPTITTIDTRPAITVWNSGRLDMFLRGADNALWHRTYAGYWQAWESLGGVLAYDPAVASWGPGRFDVFVRGADNTLLHKWYNGGTWSDWEVLGSLLSSDPSVTSWGARRLDIFVCGLGNSLWHRWFDGTWHDWEPLGGILTSAPTATSWTAGQLDVFARGADNALWHRRNDGAWHDWESLGGILNPDPTVTSWGAGRLDIFARDIGTALQHKWYDNGTWHDWESLGGVLTSSPTAISRGGTHMDVFARGTANTLQHTWYDGTWHAWERLK